MNFLPILALLGQSIALPSIPDVSRFNRQSKAPASPFFEPGNRCTNWKARLKGQTNGKRECARRQRQMQRAGA